MVSIKDVARRAGVAPSSVSRVLSGQPNVSESLRASVLAAVEELDYAPDLLASALRRGASGTVGLVLDDVLNPLHAELVDALELFLSRDGYQLLLTNSRNDSERDLESLKMLKQRRIDGLIAMVADETNTRIAAALNHFSVPIVLVDRQIPGANFSSVLSDHRGGGGAMAKYLVDRGHKRVGMIGGLQVRFPSRERVTGMEDVFAQAGVEFGPIYQRFGRGSESFGREALGDLLDLPEPPSAVVVGNAASLAGVLGECHARGIAVNDAVTVVAGDDVPLAALHSPPLTALERDMFEVGDRAAQQLIGLMRDPSTKPSTLVLPTRLIVR